MLVSEEPPEYLLGNIDGWTKKAAEFAEYGEAAWASEQPYWGELQVPESDVGLFPEDMAGLSCIELGCGTAHVAAWMCGRGANVVAIDPTPAQLDTARRLQKEYELDFVIEEGIAESVPYPDESFDFAISEYGAALWADPYSGFQKRHDF